MDDMTDLRQKVAELVINFDDILGLKDVVNNHSSKIQEIRCHIMGMNKSPNSPNSTSHLSIGRENPDFQDDDFDSGQTSFNSFTDNVAGFKSYAHNPSLSLYHIVYSYYIVLYSYITLHLHCFIDLCH